MNLACILIRNTLPFTVFWCWCSLIYMEWLGYFSLTRENGYWVLMSLQFCQWIFNLGYKCACISCEEWVSWHRFWLISRSWTLQIMFGQSASLNSWEGIIYLEVVGDHNLPLNYLWSDVLVSEDLRSYRWMHLDPCEGIYDKPLLYEKGYYSFMQYFHLLYSLLSSI